MLSYIFVTEKQQAEHFLSSFSSDVQWKHTDLQVLLNILYLFNTSDMRIVKECQSIFNFRLPSVIIPDRFETFRVKYESCNNSLYTSLLFVPAVTFAAFVILMHYLQFIL